MVFPRSSTPLLLKRSAQRPTAVSMRTEVPARFPKSLIKAMTGLATFMLLLLLFVPLLLQGDFSPDLIAYTVYAVFLISLSVTVGMGVAWMMMSNQPALQMLPVSSEAEPSVTNPATELGDASGSPEGTTASHRPSDEQAVIDHLEANDGECWQSNLSRALEWTASKTSRTLAKLEYDGTIKRIRDGMGKRIVLINKEA
jgi:hypothetical protein